MEGTKITINKKESSVIIQRSDLIEVSETHDGLVFKLKNGIDLFITDAYMPAPFKRQVKVSVDKFDKSNIVVDLANPSAPVSISNI